MQKRRFTPSPAFVVSLIALFVALGGTSYAAITALPARSVGTTQLKNNAVTGPKIKNGAITAAKISSSAGGEVEVVGAAGAPAYQGSWAAPGGGDEGVSFYKDPFGIVHLQGSAYNGSGSVTGTIFTLDPDCWPAGNLWFAVFGGSGTAAYIEITSAGDVKEVFAPQDHVGLSNVTFRAGLYLESVGDGGTRRPQPLARLPFPPNARDRGNRPAQGLRKPRGGARGRLHDRDR